MNKARYTAARALLECEDNGYSNLVLAARLRQKDLDARDRAFVTALVYGTLERGILLDELLDRCSQRPLKKLDPAVRVILRSGLYQCLYMDGVPARAAISEAVELTKRFGKSSAAGFVNAVLRKACGIDPETLNFEDETRRQSVLYCVTPQILTLLKSAYPAQWEQILRAGFDRPAQAVRVNTLKTTADGLQAKLQKRQVEAEPGALRDCLILDGKGDMTALPEFREGLFQFQGEPSQCAALAVKAKPGEHIVDLCAAPGGKSALLAAEMENRGTLDVCDAQASRLEQAKKNLARWGAACAAFHCIDAAVYRPEFAGADAVLCDVPCSGLGILAKKPDIRTKDLKGLEELIRLQRRILETAARYPRHGGRLVYATCTLNPDENEKQIARFLQTHTEYRAVRPQLPEKYQAGDEKMVTFLPQSGQTDGFFIAYLERL